MKKQDYVFFTIWVIVPLVIIFNAFLTGCTPIEIKESELIGEEILEEVIEKDLTTKKMERKNEISP